MPEGTRRWRRPPTLESLAIGALVVFAFRVGIKGISDNSAFVHLRTGIEMWRSLSIPRHDPYSFTALGHPWVVQSWLASAVYGGAYQIGGLHLVVLVNGAITAAVGLVIARLARAGTMVRTTAAASLAVLAGAVYWSPRPLMIGLLALGLLILVVERRASPLWLLPIGWVWVNTHGSFPLGFAWLVARAVGELIDRRHGSRWFALARRWSAAIRPGEAHAVAEAADPVAALERPARGMGTYLAAFAASMALGAINPLGPKLLVFPFTVGDKRQVFQNVVEWRSPNFQSVQGLFTLACLALVLAVLLSGRIGWGHILPAVGFLAAGLLSVRNVAPSAVVLAPALAAALRPHFAPTGAAAPQPRSVRRPLNAVIAGLLVAVTVVFSLGSLRSNPLDLSTYPTQAEQFLADHGYLDPTRHRVAAQDIVGCYLELVRGRSGRVFVDDRVDMYPAAVSNDYDNLLHGVPQSPSILQRYGVDTVLWDRRLALVDVLEAAGGWRLVYPLGAPGGASADHWVVLVRDPATSRIG